MSRRVVVTGVGPFASVGVGAAAFGEALRTGTSGISSISSFDASAFGVHDSAAEVLAADPGDYVRNLRPQEWGRAALFAAAAARLALADAGLEDTGPLPRAVVVMGTTGGEEADIANLVEGWATRGLGATDAAVAGRVPASRVGDAVAREFGLRGEVMTMATACAASNYALGLAYEKVRTGAAEIGVVGGAESFGRLAHTGFLRLGALDAGTCRPFDAQRGGIVIGEGAGVLVLESLDRASRRAARCYAEVLGCGLTCDAVHLVNPDPAGIARCMRMALDRAAVEPDEVDYICAHGTGTRANDLNESLAIREVFGERPPPVSSIKSMLGHTMGAASALALIACALGLAEGFIPPTANLTTPDPAFPWIDAVPNRARPARLKVVQNNGFGFGGNNAAVLLGAAP